MDINNIKNHLQQNGHFIVGDEFLKDHEINDRDAHREALKLWHNHIISIAEENGHYVLVELEKKALWINQNTQP